MSTDEGKMDTPAEETEDKEVAELEEQIDSIVDGAELFDEGEEEEEGSIPEDGDETPDKEEDPETPDDPEDSETPADEDSDIPDLEEGQVPKSQDYKNLRGIASKFKQEMKEAKAQLAAYEEALANPAAAPAPAAPTPAEDPSQNPPMSAGQVFDLLAKSRNQEFDETKTNGLTNEDIERSARIALSAYSTREILEVMDAAKNGIYGAFGEDVLEEGRAALIEAQARESIKGTTAEIKPEGIPVPPVIMEKRKESQARLVGKYPDLKDQNTDLYKKVLAALPKFQAESIGTKEKPGPNYWRVASDPNFPEWQVEQVMKDLAKETSGTAGSDSALVEENKRLKEKLDKSRQPASISGRKGSSGKSGEDTVEGIEKEIERMLRAG